MSKEIVKMVLEIEKEPDETDETVIELVVDALIYFNLEGNIFTTNPNGEIERSRL